MMEGGDYVIHYSHLHPGKAIKEVPSGYLAYLVEELNAGKLNPELRRNLRHYLRTDPEAVTKLDRGQRVPPHVVLRGFTPRARKLEDVVH